MFIGLSVTIYTHLIEFLSITTVIRALIGWFLVMSV